MMLPLKLREQSFNECLTRPCQTSLTGLVLPDQFEGGQFPDKLRDLGEEVIVQKDDL